MVNPYLPQSGSLRCRRIIFDPDAVTIVVETMTPAAACPICGRPSRGVHSRYVGTLADLPWQGRIVRWRLETRKFFCDTPACPRRIFTERLPEVAAVYARKTTRLNEALIYIAFACGGEGGSRLAVRLEMPISPDTLLRRIRDASPERHCTPRILGIDDWAMRRGQRYGTLLCDLERHCPVDVLNGREAKTLARWLQRHQEIQVITRDRASCYAQGASTAPQAIQVADRFHLMQNLRQALVRMLEHRYPTCPMRVSACPPLSWRRGGLSVERGDDRVVLWPPGRR